MYQAFFATREYAFYAWFGLVVMALLIVCVVELDLAFNYWYKDFYDLLQNATSYTEEEGIRRGFASLISLDYLTQGGSPSFIVLAFPVVALYVVLQWLARLYAFTWRQALTFYYLPLWRHVDHEIEGASQRIQEDCSRFVRIVEDLGIKVVRALFLLIAFVPMLWSLSHYVTLQGLADLPGSLVYCVFLSSVGGVIISWFVGAKLPGLEYNNQRVEAAFRKDLVLAEDDKAGYAQLDNLHLLFKGIRLNYLRLYLHYGYFDCWSSLYSQWLVMMPILILLPGLFQGVMTLGVMMQVTHAFAQVNDSLSIFLNNWTSITELRSIRKRLLEFERNLQSHQGGA